MNPGCLNNDEIFEYLTDLEPNISKNFSKVAYSQFLNVFYYPAKGCLRFMENLAVDGTILNTRYNREIVPMKELQIKSNFDISKYL